MEEIEVKTHELVVSTNVSEELKVLLDDSLKEKIEKLFFEHLEKMGEEMLKTMMIESKFRTEGFFYGSDRKRGKSEGWYIKTDCP